MAVAGPAAQDVEQKAIQKPSEWSLHCHPLRAVSNEVACTARTTSSACTAPHHQQSLAVQHPAGSPRRTSSSSVRSPAGPPSANMHAKAASSRAKSAAASKVVAKGLATLFFLVSDAASAHSCCPASVGAPWACSCGQAAAQTAPRRHTARLAPSSKWLRGAPLKVRPSRPCGRATSRMRVSNGPSTPRDPSAYSAPTLAAPSMTSSPPVSWEAAGASRATGRLASSCPSQARLRARVPISLDLGGDGHPLWCRPPHN